MAWKNARTRLNAVLAYIGNLNLPGVMNAGGIAQVHAFATTFVNAAFPVGPNDPNTAVRNFSEKMALGTIYQANDTAPDRQRLRAIFLLKAAVLHASSGAASNYDTIPLPRTYVNPQAMLADALWKARLCWGQANASTVPHQQMLQYIRNNCLAFMATNKLRIYGSTHQAVDGMGNPADQNVQNFRFCFSPASDRYEFWPPGGGPAGAYAVAVASVVAKHWSLVPGRGVAPLPLAGAGATFANIHGTELGGANIMLTTQFTGCALCIKTGGGNVYAAHISPGAPNTPPQIGGGQVLAQQLDGQNPNVGAADFANVGGGAQVHVYGRGHSNMGGALANGYPAGEMYVLGFDAGTGVNGWDIYAQYSNAGTLQGAPQKVW
jgi:hypothetical protein